METDKETDIWHDFCDTLKGTVSMSSSDPPSRSMK